MSSPPPAEWTVIYHAPGTLKGRGEFLVLMLEDAGVSYDYSGEIIYGPKGLMDAFRGDNIPDVDADIAPFPLLFPPALWHRPASGGEEVVINQVAACMMYLGEHLGYAPKSSLAEKARADAILLNALDYISDGRRSFHPVEDKMSYNDQKEQADKVSKVFSQTRMHVYLRHFQKVVKKAGPKQPIAGGAKVSYADFALFHVLDATVSQFNTEYYEYAWDNCNVPALKEYYEWMKNRPNLVKYFQSSRCAPYSGNSMM